MRKVYCIDLDGTLCTHEQDYNDAKPFLERIAIVNMLYDAGAKIIIDTARGNTTGIDWTDITEKQLKEWGVNFHVLMVGTKISADYYIDDKAINSNKFFE